MISGRKDNSAMVDERGALTRRAFLKTTGIAGGAMALCGHALAAVAHGEETKPSAGDEQVFRGVCRPNCFAYCHLNVHVREGKVSNITKAPYNNPEFTRICHRGLSHIQRIYADDRILHPLRRVAGTERGEGAWEQVSWEEAIKEFADHIRQAQDQYGPQAFAVHVGSNLPVTLGYNMYNRLWALVKPSIINQAMDQGNYYATQRMAGPLTNLWEGNDASDMRNAKTIVLWGSNVSDSQVQTWHFIKEAKQNGTKLVCIDPTFTYAASKSDLWIPVRPGADMPLYMYIMRAAVERGGVDSDYLVDNTVAPFLVRGDTGRFLRAGDADVELAGGAQAAGGADEYLCVEDGGLVGIASATRPDLEAAYDLGGVSCRTAYSLLLDELEKFPADYVSELTEVPVDVLDQLADVCLDGPVFHYTGFGEQAHVNGHQAAHAGLTMAALTGNLGKPGASYGNCWYMYYYANAAFSAPDGETNTTQGILNNDLPSIVETGRLCGEEFPVKVAYVCYGNPLNTAMDTNRLREAYKRLDYVVVADSTMTSTAQYADLVLPIAQWFEQTDVTFGGQTLTLSYNEKAIDPLGECKTDADIVRLLAQELGYGEYFQMTDEEALTELFGGQINESLGISYERIKSEGDVSFAAKPTHVAFEGGAAAGAFSTSSGRLEFYVEDPQPFGKYQLQPTDEQVANEHLPHWAPPAEAWPEGEAMKSLPFILMSERPRFRVHSQWARVKALRELDPEPIVKMNPADANARGLADDSYVECFNDHGHCVARLVCSDAIRPGTLVYPKGWEIDQYKAGSWTELCSNQYNPFVGNANFMDVACDVRAWEE